MKRWKEGFSYSDAKNPELVNTSSQTLAWAVTGASATEFSATAILSRASLPLLRGSTP